MLIGRWYSHLAAASDALRRRRPFVFVPWNNDIRVNDPLMPWIVYHVSYESTQIDPGEWTVVDAVCWYCQHTTEIMVRLKTGHEPTLSIERDRFLRVHAHGAEYPLPPSPEREPLLEAPTHMTIIEDER